jgi:hypothetical protein
MQANNYFNYLLIFKWSDALEIIFFAASIYYFSLWLKNDKQKNLLAIFYLTFSIFICSYFTNMNAITNFFLIFWPTILTIFLLLHQNILQKNFIAMKKILPAKPVDFIWIDDFIRSCLNAIGNNKQITAIIEGTDSLEEFIKAPFSIVASVNKDLIDALINSPTFDQQKMIWINYEGKLQAINSSWNIKNSQFWTTDDIEEINQWQQDSIIFTSKTDAIAFRSYPAKRTFDVIVQGRLIEDLSPNNALTLISQYIKQNEMKTLKTNKDKNEIKFKNNQFKQPSA